MSALNKVLSIFVVCAMAVAGYFMAHSEVPGSDRPEKIAANKAVSLRKQDSDIDQLKNFLATNKSKAQAQSDLDSMIEAVMEDKDTYETPTRSLTAQGQKIQRSAAPVAKATPTQTIVLDGTSAAPPLTPEEQIRAMNVPESVRQAILKNYARTGIWPVLRENTSASDRAPASQAEN